MNYLHKSVRELKAVGAQREAGLNKLGIYTIEDMIRYYPRDYMDRSQVTPLSQLAPGENGVIRVKLETDGENFFFGDRTLTKARAGDGTGQINIVFFGQPYIKQRLKKGMEFYFMGKVWEKLGSLQMENPDWEEAGRGESLSVGRIVPVYPALGGLGQKTFRRFILSGLEHSGEMEEIFPHDIREEYALCERRFAVNNIHFPQDNGSYFAARKRLVFEELFMMQRALLQLKVKVKRGKGVPFTDFELEDFYRRMPFSFTAAQQQVMEDILRDLSRGGVMNRLIQGDVGSGKTAVCEAACCLAMKNGYQAAIMAPTETLARQHFKGIAPVMESLGYKTALLTGSVKKKEKDESKAQLAAGETSLVVGTHAVIQSDVIFHNLGLVVTDEQHRFGVGQRGRLTGKGDGVHTLVMSATPIPRTLGLVLYGDMDISIIDSLPPGRLPVETYSVASKYRDRIYNFIKKEMDSGRQAYIICPVIEESDKMSMKAVLGYGEELKNKVFSGYAVAILHGKMKAEEKNRVMEGFASGEIKMLVSTTVIEVGVNVPNASVMVIENAERFGLSQLHQLRGRVGRGTHKSYCILVTDSAAQVTKERMNAMTATSDGFKIAELDLKLRGPGDFFGTLQHGIPEMRLANLYRDMDILKQAQKAVLQAEEDQGGRFDGYLDKLDREIEKILGNTENLSL